MAVNLYQHTGRILSPIHSVEQPRIYTGVPDKRFRVRPKPHIRIDGKLGWLCTVGGCGGWGRTPKEAHSNCMRQVR
jgi:hypothetical protein